MIIFKLDQPGSKPARNFTDLYASASATDMPSVGLMEAQVPDND